MNEFLAALENNEAAINAVVGIVTLLAALWGVACLIALPVMRSESRPSDAPRFGLWSSLINRGVDSRADFADQIAARTLNACSIVVVGITFPLIVLGLAERSIGISLVNLGLFLAAVAAYNLHAASYLFLSRWLLIVSTQLYWLINILMMGPRVGLEYCMGGVLLLPLLIFKREEKSQIIFACATTVLALPVALAIEPVLSNQWPFSEAELPFAYYHGNSIVVACMVLASLYFFNRSADLSFYQLEDQQQKSLELVHGLLPAYVAKKMHERETKVAEWHSEATVLFATVVGFESLYTKISAVQILEMLREIFDEFDALTEKFGIEKVNTLGTNYIAATGIDPSRESAPENLAMVATGMRSVIERVSETIDHPFTLHIGISTGEVVSGIIGEDLPSFDIWGETVELAHSMRDNGPSNTIAVSMSAYWRLKQSFSFEKAPDLEETYFLTGAA